MVVFPSFNLEIQEISPNSQYHIELIL